MTEDRQSVLRHCVSFTKDSHDPVHLERGSILSESLNVANSPLLFGCRTGICGTCLIEVEAQENGVLNSPSIDEKELLELIAPDNPRARLACQIELCADIRIRYLGL
ncbi:MAG TPA: 2Fe-2S iron-sulfur cluster-binding protein [Blastocatellia bacterium]